MAQINLNEQARQILKIAEEYGVEQNFFFITTFKRYQVQIGILTERGARAGNAYTVCRYSLPVRAALRLAKSRRKLQFMTR